LLTKLCDAGYRVSLETSGALPLGEVDPRVVKVVDVKTPASGEAGRNLYDELARLQPHDLVKFVIVDRADYEWSRDVLARLSLPAGVDVYFSPSHEQLAPGVLADWMLADGLAARLQLQMHKYLWGNVPGR
jgi:7-carboxy-7-deazaguanine synthase